MNWDYEELQKLFKKYNINDIDYIEKCILQYKSNQSEEIQYVEEKNEKYCSYSSHFPLGIPDARKLKIIHETFFQEYKTAKEFAEKIIEKINNKKKKKFNTQTITKYLTCQNCDEYYSTNSDEAPKKKQKLPHAFLEGFSEMFLEDKYLTHKELFVNFESCKIEDFVSLLKSKTQEGFKPEGGYLISKYEKDTLYNKLFVAKEVLQINLLEIIEGKEYSDAFMLNIALFAFEREFIDQASKLLLLIKDKAIKKNKLYIHLLAKIYSKYGQDQDVIDLLEEFNSSMTSIDPETQNLLAASLKRYSINLYDKSKIKNIEIIILGLEKAKKIYSIDFNANNNYYPFINIAYIDMIICYLNNNSFTESRHKITVLKGSMQFEKNDWWSFISGIEFNILLGKYKEATKDLGNYLDELEKDMISEFEIESTIRQLKIYFDFCKKEEKNELSEIINVYLPGILNEIRVEKLQIEKVALLSN